MDFRLDMSMMLAMHDALRRELVQVGRVAARRDDNPGRLLHAALGWELFKKFLTVHHRSEDDALWPPLRARVAGRPDQVALVDALEAEHAVIEPLLAAIDAAAADPDYGYQRFGDIVDELAAKLHAHLAHEETDGLPLIDASLTPAEWQHFAQVHTERIRGDAPMYMP
jgi:Hemerythrin HHE cation binding domain